MQAIINRVTTALKELQAGRMLILTDHPDREDEGDLIMAAEHITADKMNFIIRHSSGIVCVSMNKPLLDKFNLPLMVPAQENTSARGTPFTLSIDAMEGITTGVSATDRAVTIQKLLNKNAGPHDFAKPGHVFPLLARSGGVLERAGHTEGALDLVKLANLKPVAVLCEIMNTDGTMARGKSLLKFAKQNNLFMLSIEEIIAYRIYHETLIQAQASANLPIEKYGNFKMTVIKEKFSGQEHVVLIKKRKSTTKDMLVRIHSSCLTGDLFSSQRCDCHQQLHHSLERISKEGGVLIYLNQEGRGIGLFNKIRAYALQEQGYDTVEANEKLGLPIDAREYHIAANILKMLHIKQVRLLTSNPQKIFVLEKYGIQKISVEPMPGFSNEHNCHYLQVKKAKLHKNTKLKTDYRGLSL